MRTVQQCAIAALAGIAAALILCALGACASADSAACATDTECMEFCPPPGDEPECDGGPN